MARPTSCAAALAALLFAASPGPAAAESAIYLRELTQITQPWAKVAVGKVHGQPKYSPLPPVRVDPVDDAFSVTAREGKIVYSFTVSERSGERLVLSTPVNEEAEMRGSVFVAKPRTLEGGRHVKSVPRGAWTPLLYEDGYGGRRWEVWWGDPPPKP